MNMSEDLLFDNSPNATITKSQVTLSFRRRIRSSNRSFRKSKLKLLLKQFINFTNTHPFLLTTFKFLLGFLFLSLPIFFMIFMLETKAEIPSKHFFFPYYLSLSLLCSVLMIICIIRLCDECLQHGLTISTWTRKNIFKIFSVCFYICLIIWGINKVEHFCLDLPLLKENVDYETSNEGISLNEGSHLFRYIMVYLFWDGVKDLNYFDINKNNFFVEIKKYLVDDIIIPIIVIMMFALMKMIMFKTNMKKDTLYGMLYIVILFECFYFWLYPVGEIKKNVVNMNGNFKYKNVEFYIEMLPICGMICILMCLHCYYTFGHLYKRKYFSYKSRQPDAFTMGVVGVSGVIGVAGYCCLLVLVLFLMVNRIKVPWDKKNYDRGWRMIYIGLSGVLVGNSVVFGNFYFKLICSPVVEEVYDSILKNRFYIKVRKRSTSIVPSGKKRKEK